MPSGAETAAAHIALGQALLLAGDFDRGLEEMEWRWRLPGVSLCPFPQPLWDGSPLEGRRILLWAEQGLGDTLQFVRYAAPLHERGARVSLECQPALPRLLRGAAGADEVIPYGAPLPDFDLHAPPQRLPWIMRTRLESIPNCVPYVAVDPDLVEQWRERVASHRGHKVGLVWAGNRQQVNDRFRSLTLARFAPLAAVAGVAWFSLQKSGGSEVEATAAPHCIDLDRGATDLADTAAAMLSLDLVISADTAAAHLAGALARPVWTLIPCPPDYRWLAEGEGSPWYPTMRLFRQSSPGDWERVIESVERALSDAVRR
jgi:hypothetical protein